MSARSVATLDPRESRFIASVTAVVLAGALALGSPGGLYLLAIQMMAFAFGAVLGMHVHPYALLYRVALSTRLKPTSMQVAERPLRFGQGIAVLFAVVALLAGTIGVGTVYYVITGILLVTALAQALFNYCVSCKLYNRIVGGIATTADLTEPKTASTPEPDHRDVTIG